MGLILLVHAKLICCANVAGVGLGAECFTEALVSLQCAISSSFFFYPVSCVGSWLWLSFLPVELGFLPIQLGEVAHGNWLPCMATGLPVRSQSGLGCKEP